MTVSPRYVLRGAAGEGVLDLRETPEWQNLTFLRGFFITPSIPQKQRNKEPKTLGKIIRIRTMMINVILGLPMGPGRPWQLFTEHVHTQAQGTIPLIALAG